jgi:uncharacterized protein DUF4124
MLRPLAITTLVIAGMCGVAHADVYRWVDAKGEAHYTDRWVPGSELIKSNKPRPFGPEAGPAPAAAKSTPTSKLQQQSAEQAVKQDVAKTKEAQCKQAKERYQKAVEARRIYKPAKEGDTDRVYMSDAETDAYRLQARNDVTLACGSPPPPVQP